MKITIGLPTRNRAQLLQRALASLVGQGEVRVIVSDNASTDNTRETVDGFRDKLDLVYIRTDEVLTSNANFDLVLRAAKTEYFGWLADDDWYEPGSVMAMAEILDAQNDAVLVVPEVRYIGDDGKVSSVELPVGFTHPRPVHRASAYFDQVKWNGMFYGLRRRRHSLVTPLPVFFGGDWAHLIALAMRGTFVVAPNAVLNRSDSGSSSDPSRLARSLGVGTWGQRYPARYLPLRIAAEMSRGLPPFDEQRTLRRAASTVQIVGPRWIETEFWFRVTQVRRIREYLKRAMSTLPGPMQ